MQHTVQEFLKNEICEMHKNIDRIQNHRQDEKGHYSGQQALLEIQEAHLALIEDLSKRVQNFEDLMSLCHRMILQNEAMHRKVALLENDSSGHHGVEWWNSLHLIQFWSDLLNRSSKWQQN